MRKLILMALLVSALAVQAKTLIVYYSYTNNVEKIVNELKQQIGADVVEIQPTEKGLDYAANNYAIGSAQIAAIRNNPDDASSYPAIDPVTVNLDEYNTMIIGAPLWWSQMAAPLQTYLFNNGQKMAGKNIGLIVSSASSGINGVEADAKRLILDGKFFSSSLWIKSSQTSNAKSMLEQWLKDIHYNDLAAGIENVYPNEDGTYTVYSLSGMKFMNQTSSIDALDKGAYIINGKKTYVSK